MRNLIFAFLFLCSFNVFSQSLSISELEEQVNAAEAQRNVSARSYIHYYWQLADLYLDNNDYHNAYRVIISALRLDPWNYKYQYIAAEIEMLNGDHERANNRLNFIINNLRDLAAIYDNSITQRNSLNFDEITDAFLNLPGYYLYIATFPNLNSDVVELIAARVAAEFGIEVRIINIGASESEVNIRDRQLNIYNDIVDDVLSRYSRISIDNFLEQLGLTMKDLETREGRRIFSYTLYSQSEEGLNTWREIEAIRSQYDANALMNQISGRFRNIMNDPYCLGILGITAEDIYTDTYNFLFGLGQTRLGVMSYARFLLDNPSAEQFEKRAVMQAFSSAGIIIGIPRCTHPSCARAYPHSLEEHDRKEEAICNECRQNLRQRYARL